MKLFSIMIAGAGFACVIVTQILLIIRTNRIVSLLYDEFVDTWNALGSPSGYFCRPTGSSWLTGSLSRDRLLRRLIFSRPEWTSLDPRLADLRGAVVTQYWCGVAGCVLALVGFLLN